MDNLEIPSEFDIIRTRDIALRAKEKFDDQNPNGIGYTIHGWDFTAAEIKEALKEDRMLNPAFELAWNICPWNCIFCYTESSTNPKGRKVKLANELTLEEKLCVVDEAYELGAKSINIVGAGEPTIDPDFWNTVQHICGYDMVPIIFTEGTFRLNDREFAERLYDLGATIVLKVNSLWNKKYQNAVVNNGRENVKDYLEDRNRVLEVLMEVGFNSHDPTRLAFDTIICAENYHEIKSLHRFARRNNIFVLFVNYLPSGRSSEIIQNSISLEKQREIFDMLADVDKEEYGLVHRSDLPYAGGTPCSILGSGLYVKITGETFDCPGEGERLGNVRDTMLRELWEKAGHVRKKFNGKCPPREEFWKRKIKRK